MRMVAQRVLAAKPVEHYSGFEEEANKTELAEQRCK
jgi:hypothetical protein